MAWGCGAEAEGLSPISGPVRCAGPAQCLGSLAQLLAADLAQHQSRVAAGHGGRQDDFRVSERLKRSEAARRSLRTRPTGRPVRTSTNSYVPSRRGVGAGCGRKTDPVVAAGDCLPVDDAGARAQASECLDDEWEAVGPVLLNAVPPHAGFASFRAFGEPAHC